MLIIGSNISHYKTVEKLGEGWYGCRLQAEDTKLERTVALKFLAGHLLNDGEAALSLGESGGQSMTAAQRLNPACRYTLPPNAVVPRNRRRVLYGLLAIATALLGATEVHLTHKLIARRPLLGHDGSAAWVSLGARFWIRMNGGNSPEQPARQDNPD